MLATTRPGEPNAGLQLPPSCRSAWLCCGTSLQADGYGCSFATEAHARIKRPFDQITSPDEMKALSGSVSRYHKATTDGHFLLVGQRVRPRGAAREAGALRVRRRATARHRRASPPRRLAVCSAAPTVRAPCNSPMDCDRRPADAGATSERPAGSPEPRSRHVRRPKRR